MGCCENIPVVRAGASKKNGESRHATCDIIKVRRVHHGDVSTCSPWPALVLPQPRNPGGHYQQCHRYTVCSYVIHQCKLPDRRGIISGRRSGIVMRLLSDVRLFTQFRMGTLKMVPRKNSLLQEVVPLLQQKLVLTPSPATHVLVTQVFLLKARKSSWEGSCTPVCPRNNATTTFLMGKFVP